MPADLVGGRFRLERAIGRGGMATVYDAVELASGKRVALKRLHAAQDARKHKQTLQLFEREFHTLAHLAHPRVVEVSDYAVDDTGPYYAMELLDGGDLQQLSPLDWRRACALARDVCSALSLVHSRREVHRDLSPRNVRSTSDGPAQLIGFGAMVVMGPTRQVVGTPAYCAPEVLNLQALDQRTDLYSLIRSAPRSTTRWSGATPTRPRASPSFATSGARALCVHRATRRRFPRRSTRWCST